MKNKTLNIRISERELKMINEIQAKAYVLGGFRPSVTDVIIQSIERFHMHYMYDKKRYEKD